MSARHATQSHHPFFGVGALVSPLTTALLGVAAAALLTCAAAVVLLGVSVRTVLTGSMHGTFDAGSIVVSREIPAGHVHVGQVLVFTPPGETTAYTHRVVSVRQEPGGPVIRTKGDANASPDPWEARIAGSHAREVVFAVPRVGRFLQPLHQHALTPFLLGALGAVLAVTGSRAILAGSHPQSARS